ncbi:MAG TPA: L,D-transpeptidase [Roseiarcus sp.]|jgi:lipoprotein-anchoring transpeptidase ErfK/SrfK
MIGKLFAIGAVLLGGALLSGCSPIQTQMAMGSYDTHLTPRDKQMMALAPKEEWTIPIDRRRIADPTGEPPGTIVVDTTAKNLYYVLPGRQAIQYRVATGAEAYGWTGRATVGHMAEWPTWMPTASIMQRWPEFRVYLSHGPLAGAYDNPLGARALYLYQGNHDTLYRIHGTNEPEEIGEAVSSGCIRMRDLDVIDLYSRVHVGTQVVVK